MEMAKSFVKLNSCNQIQEYILRFAIRSGGQLPAILFDLGGTYIRCAISKTCCNATRSSLLHYEKKAIRNFLDGTPSDNVWQDLFAIIRQYVDRISVEVGPDAPVIISFAGPIDSAGAVASASSILGHAIKFPDVRSILSRETRRSVFLLNDMSAATWYISSVSSTNRFMAITVSSGIGCKIFDRQSAHGVADGVTYAGEIGHIVVDDDPNALICDCGGVGHLQAIASGRGIERMAYRHAARNRAGFMNSLCSTEFGAFVNEITNEKHLVPAAIGGDAWALSVIRECTVHLGRILASITIAAGLEKIIITGGLAQSLGQVYLDLLLEAMRRGNTFGLFPFNLQLLQMCSPGDEISLLGAAIYANVRLGVE